MKQSNLSLDNANSKKFLSKREIVFTKKKTKSQKNAFDKKQKRDKNKNSLDEVTRRFIKYISKVNTDEIDINKVVEALNIKKRRIYDVTNVLEGK